METNSLLENKFVHLMIFNVGPGLLAGIIFSTIVTLIFKMFRDLWNITKYTAMKDLTNKKNTLLAKHIGRRVCDHDHRKIIALYPITKGEPFNHPILGREMVRLTRPSKQRCIFCERFMIADVYGMCEKGDDWKSQIEKPENDSEA